MKKHFVMLSALCAVTLCAVATKPSPNSYSMESALTLASTTKIYYNGPAYAMGSNDLIPRAGGSINVNWTTDGCFVNETEISSPQPIKGDGYPMYVNGKVKHMKYRVLYKGEWYYFQG